MTPASRFLPSSVSRNLPSASTRRTISSEVVLAFEREHRIDQIVPRALLAQLDLQAVGEEGEQVERLSAKDMRLHQMRPVSCAFPRPTSASSQVRIVACAMMTSAAGLRSNARPISSGDSVECRYSIERSGSRNSFSMTMRITPSAARRSAYGSFDAGRLLVDRPEADQRVDLVGERDRDRDRIGRHQIVRPFRLVVILAGVRDGFVLALRLGVVAAHQALQLGEFADHFGEQVGLAQAAPRARPLRGRRRRAAQAVRRARRCARCARPACRASRGTRCARISAAGLRACVFRSVS